MERYNEKLKQVGGELDKTSRNKSAWDGRVHSTDYYGDEENWQTIERIGGPYRNNRTADDKRRRNRHLSVNI